MPVPSIGALWPSGHVLRPGRSSDAETIRSWKSDDMQVAGALKFAVEHVEAANGKSFVLEQHSNGALIGVFTLIAPHFQFAYVIGDLQRKGLGVLSGVILIENYFACTTEPWIGDSGSLTGAGYKWANKLGFKNGRLTRVMWHELAPKFAKLFV